MNASRRMSGYPSDLTDFQWARLEPLLPPLHAVGRHRTVSPREVANAINYRWETGCVWRMLPHDFPPWGTVYAYFRDWQRAGVVRQLRDILTEAEPKTRPRSGWSGSPMSGKSSGASAGADKASPMPVEDSPHRTGAGGGFSSPRSRSNDLSQPGPSGMIDPAADQSGTRRQESPDT